ncbi:nitrile hydratase [Salinihabitans flavidus]|uniref:Nitrile hydratase subunit beta n=1 Tax=Salinihabitans flavidus TaxID=569882 RepID=A0A1H8RBD6_9RHOB|nr:nitrile hydratase subunit beta [Salinihabitans flavidus]SEO63498.1 nitrile hydratase [Salinihabitans flavidus]
MSRLHDMGGRIGDGAVNPADDTPYTQDWQGRALALTMATEELGTWSIDSSRHAGERLIPHDYMNFSYFEKWLASLADLLVARGLVSEAELRRGAAAGVSGLADRMLKPGDVGAMAASGAPSERSLKAPARFANGERVRTRRPARNILVDQGHTRLPSYAAGCVGEVVNCHGAHVLPDSNAHDLGEAAEPLYSVRFAARELWGRAENPDDAVTLDLWESYLEPEAGA